MLLQYSFSKNVGKSGARIEIRFRTTALQFIKQPAKQNSADSRNHVLKLFPHDAFPNLETSVSITSG